MSQFASLSASWLVGWCVSLVPAPCLEVVEVSINDVAKRLNQNLRNWGTTWTWTEAPETLLPRPLDPFSIFSFDSFGGKNLWEKCSHHLTHHCWCNRALAEIVDISVVPSHSKGAGISDICKKSGPWILATRFALKWYRVDIYTQSKGIYNELAPQGCTQRQPQREAPLAESCNTRCVGSQDLFWAKRVEVSYVP